MVTLRRSCQFVNFLRVCPETPGIGQIYVILTINDISPIIGGCDISVMGVARVLEVCIAIDTACLIPQILDFNCHSFFCIIIDIFIIYSDQQILYLSFIYIPIIEYYIEFK